MSRIVALETNERHTERRMDAMASTFASMSDNLQDIRDAVLSANLSELPKRVANLEKSRWISYGASGGAGGGAMLILIKMLSALGVLKL